MSDTRTQLQFPFYVSFIFLLNVRVKYFTYTLRFILESELVLSSMYGAGTMELHPIKLDTHAHMEVKPQHTASTTVSGNCHMINTSQH